MTEKAEEGPVKITETAERTDKAGRIVRHTKVTERAHSSKTTETKSEAHQEGSLKAESAAQSASKPSLGFLVWPWILGAAGAALAAFLAWKLKPAWLAGVLKLFGV